MRTTHETLTIDLGITNEQMDRISTKDKLETCGELIYYIRLNLADMLDYFDEYIHDEMDEFYEADKHGRNKLRDIYETLIYVDQDLENAAKTLMKNSKKISKSIKKISDTLQEKYTKEEVA